MLFAPTVLFYHRYWIGGWNRVLGVFFFFKTFVSNFIVMNIVNIRTICVFAVQALLWNTCMTEWSRQTVEWGEMSRRWWWLLLMDGLRMKCRKMLPGCNMLVRPSHFTHNLDYPITAWAMARYYMAMGLLFLFFLNSRYCEKFVYSFFLHVFFGVSKWLNLYIHTSV